MIEKLLGVIGDPIEHSLSPVLFEYVLRELNLPYRYRAFHVKPDELRDFLNRARVEGMIGLSVTIPHKERVIPLLDALDAQAEKLGAVNTISNEQDRLVGYNTDVLGFSRSLEVRGINLKDQHAVVLGAGGAARAVVYALIALGVHEIILANRSHQRVEQLSLQAISKTGFRRICSLDLSDSKLAGAIQQASLLVNATPVGMQPLVDACPVSEFSCLHEGLIVYDLIYNPPRTRLLREAQNRGARVISGLDMLIYQGIESLQLWAKRELELPETLIRRVRQALEERLLLK